MEFIQSKWKLFGGIALVVLVLTILIVSLSGTSNEQQPQCTFSGVKPSPNVPNDVATEDLKALASFAGHIELLQGDKKLYLPVKLVKLSLQEHTNSTTVIMAMDCAEVSMELSVVNDLNSMNTIDVRFERPTQLNETTTNVISAPNWSCRIPYAGLSFPVNSAFVCQKTLYRSCQVDGREEIAYLSLVMNQIKLELHGDPQKIRRGEYSKASSYCW